MDWEITDLALWNSYAKQGTDLQAGGSVSLSNVRKFPTLQRANHKSNETNHNSFQILNAKFNFQLGSFKLL